MISLYARRRMANMTALVLGLFATVIGLVFLCSILWITVSRGIDAIDLELFTKTTAYGADGGLANAIVGSLLVDLLAIGLCAPVGVMAGMWLAEYAARSRLGTVTRFLNDILLSAPSIVLGLFVYMVVVLPTTAASDGDSSFSAIAGAVALALIGLPVVVRTTDEMLRLVPSTLREAALSLGIPQWKLTLNILLRAAGSGIATGVLLALARLAGETAPLLFTAFGNNFMSTDPMDPMATLPVTIYQYTNDPNPAMHALAWAGALLITMFVLGLSLIGRFVVARGAMRHD